MNEIYMLDAFFRVLRPIRSLPPWHGARWSAWLRFACAAAGFKLGDLLLSIHPLRSGQKPWLEGDLAILRMGVASLPLLPELTQALGSTKGHGEFSAYSLDLAFFRDAFSGAPFAPDAIIQPEALTPLCPATVRGETDALMNLSAWTLRLASPLRLKAGQGGKGRDKFCDPAFFASREALAFILAKVRFLDAPETPLAAGVGITSANLRWEDLRYDPRRQIALGGLVGEIRCQGAPDRPTAERLVLGQYLGAGKNPLFGLGMWRIPELEHSRMAPLTEEDMHKER